MGPRAGLSLVNWGLSGSRIQNRTTRLGPGWMRAEGGLKRGAGGRGARRSSRRPPWALCTLSGVVRTRRAARSSRQASDLRVCKRRPTAQCTHRRRAYTPPESAHTGRATPAEIRASCGESFTTKDLLANTRTHRYSDSLHTRSAPIAGWSSLVARRAHNPKVVGSNPAPATIQSQPGGHVTSGLFHFQPICKRCFTSLSCELLESRTTTY